MSRWTRETSRPNCWIAAIPTVPAIWSSSGAIASRARPSRSSLRTSGAIPKQMFDGPFACPVDDADQRSRGGQPDGDHGFDDLAVGSQRDIADRAEPIADSGSAGLVQEGGDHGQAPERLLDTRRPVDGGFRHATYRDMPHAESHLETLKNQDTVKQQRGHTTASAENKAS